jgi:DNA polymerase-3 subunit gamma/tau
MSYLVLARKWRPESFSDVVGQKHVVLTLASAIRADRIAHAYLFAGPRGVGKTTIARILAKALNCEKGPSDEPCGKCDSCSEIALGKSLDVIEIDGASNRKIEDARGIRETVQYAPLSGRMKIYIIDEAHMLTREAFNALLKTLEEPPAHVVFVLATTEPGKIPDTITSRCQRFDFHRISASEIEGRLSEIAESEKIKIDDGAIKLVAARADGSMRDAESLLDQLISVGHAKIKVDDVAAVLGIPDIDVFFALTDAIAERDTGAVLGGLEKALDAGFDPRDLVDGLVEHLRNLLLMAAAPSPERLVGRIDSYRSHDGASSRLSENDLVRLVRMGVDAQATAKWSTQPGLIVELALLRMARLANAIEIEEVVRALGEAGRAGGGGAAASGEPEGDGTGRASSRERGSSLAGPGNPGRASVGRAPLATNRERHETAAGTRTRSATGTSAGQTIVASERPAAPESAPGDADAGPAAGPIDSGRWPEVLELIRSRKPALAAFLADAQASHLGDGPLSLSVPNGSHFHREQLKDRGNMKLMERAASTVYGGTVKLAFTFGAALAHESGGSGAPRTMRGGGQPSAIDGAVRDASDDPTVRRVIEMFDGEITKRKREE